MDGLQCTHAALACWQCFAVFAGWGNWRVCNSNGKQFSDGVQVDEDIVTLTPWTERDYRTDTDPWWA
jgi:hypothetical protein